MLKRFLLIVLIVIGLFCPFNKAESNHSITVKFVDHWMSRLIKGVISDDFSKKYKKASITISGCDDQSKIYTNSKGEYLVYVSNCPEYNFSVFVCDINILNTTIKEEDKEVLLFDFELLNPSILINPLFKSLINSLLILSSTSSNPVDGRDWNHNKRIDVNDALYIFNIINKMYHYDNILIFNTMAQLYQNQCKDVQNFHKKTIRSFSAVNVELWSDEDGDGTKELVNTYLTDNYGNLTIDNLKNGIYTLLAQNNQLTEAVQIKNIIIAGQDIDLKAVLLKPVGSISGKVILEGQTDYSDAAVYIPGTSFNAITDQNGIFKILYIPEGTYSIKVVKDKFGTITIQDVSVYSGVNSDLGIINLPSIVGFLSGTVKLSGQYTHAGILLNLKNMDGNSFITSSNASGKFFFNNIPVGSYSIMATIAGYSAVQKDIFISVGSNSIIFPKLFPNESYGTLAGNIRLENASNHSGAMIRLAGTQYMAVSNSNGEYAINHIPEGKYTAFITADGYKGKQSNLLEVTSQSITRFDDELSEQFLVETCRICGSIIGRALYNNQSNHLGISVKIEDTDIPLAGTDSNGSFIINNVPAGTYTLLFSESNYNHIKRTGIVVSAWNTATINDVILIPPTGSIRGLIRIEDSLPDDDVYQDVNVYGIYADGRTTITTHPVQYSNGAFLIENAEATTITLIASKPGYQCIVKPVIKVTAGRLSILDTPIFLNKPPDPPTNIKIVQASGNSVTITWTPSNSQDIEGYNIYMGTTSNEINQKCNTSLITNPYFQLNDLNKGITHFFTIEAVDTGKLVSTRVPIDGTCKWTILPKRTGDVTDSNNELSGNLIDIALNADGSTGFVANQNCNCIVVMTLNQANPSAINSLQLTLPSSTKPVQMAFDPIKDLLYVIDSNHDKVFVADTKNYKFNEQTIFNEKNLIHVYLSSDGEYLILGSKNPDRVHILYASTYQSISIVDLGIDFNPESIVLVNQKIYVLGTYANKIRVIDFNPDSNKYLEIIKTISIGSSSHAMLARSDGKYLYVSLATAKGEIKVIDLEIDEVIKTITIDSGLVNKNPTGMAINDNILYVANYGDSTITLINTQTNQMIDLSSQLDSGGNGPLDIVVSPDGNKIYVMHNTHGSVEIFEY